ncbi:protein PTHB1 [Apis laboriosa]|uniref:protein PTHB1 n=1 Tax=Apis laboriosa TaxID=183418 RepID=UPI001CC4660B|nr:protein PTHB1 [Apis laboriosa]
MSLFKTKEWWQTRCGANETFDKHSLMAAPLFGKERHHDIIVVTSHDGYLRMYDPSSRWIDETKSPTNYKSTDLMIEKRVGDCIVDVKTGKFVSGSQDSRLAVLTDSKLLVYDMILIEGSETEYGDRCELKINYEHRLPRFPASLTVGPFGGVRGRDFLCVQCLDGTLLFYEQEVFVFSQTRRNQLLAEPIVYVSRYDLFVAATSSWILECHRYQSMAEWSRIGHKDGDGVEEGHGRSSSSLEPDWTFNIGEPILGIETVTLTSFEIGIVVLGERHLYCLKDNCASVKYAKRFEYRPVCFRAYVIEPDGKLMVLVIADTGTLMIYEGTTLKWSAQLPFTPVTVARVQLRHLEGAIVVLSADGRLEACYLGSEPSLFVAPPLHPRGYDYAAAERELSKLRECVCTRKEDRTSDAGAEAELVVTINASMDSDPSPVCEVDVQLSSYAALRDVQVCVHVSKPLLADVDFYTVPNLYENHSRRTVVSVEGDWPSYTMDVTVVVTYKTDEGVLRAVRKIGQIPIKMALRSCPPEKSSSFVTVVKSNAPSTLPFTQLFPEFAWADESAQRQGWNAVGLGHVNSDRRVTVVSSVANYRVQSSDGSSSTLIVRRLIDRWARKKGEGGNVGANVGQNHVRSVHQRMDDHFAARREIEKITNEIGLLTNQLRSIARKTVRIVRERNERSLTDTGLPFLFESTCSSIFARLEDLAKARAKRERSGHELRCNVELLLALLRSNVAEDKYEALRTAIGFEPSDRTDWEEIANAGLAALLKSVSRKSGGFSETRSCTWTGLVPITSEREMAKLKTRLSHAIGRLGASRESDIAEIENNDFPPESA